MTNHIHGIWMQDWVEAHDPEACITIDPAIRSGTPCLVGYRVSAEDIAEHYWAGSSIDTICTIWETRRAVVLVACWYVALHTTRTWRKRWGAWADIAFDALWQGNYAAVPDPPRPGAG